MPWKFWTTRGEKNPDPGRPPEDEEILSAVRELQAGAGPEAFGPIFRRYHRRLHMFFKNQTALREEADDLTQITLMRAYEKIRLYRFESSFEAWIRQIAENIWLNAVRERRAVKRAALSEDLESAKEIPDSSPGPYESASSEETIRRLREAVDSLPEGMRRCTELRLYQDLSYYEISAALGLSVDTVRVQLFRSKKALREILESGEAG